MVNTSLFRRPDVFHVEFYPLHSISCCWKASDRPSGAAKNELHDYTCPACPTLQAFPTRICRNEHPKEILDRTDGLEVQRSVTLSKSRPPENTCRMKRAVPLWTAGGLNA